MRNIHRITALFAGCALAAVTLGACDEDADGRAQPYPVAEDGAISPAELGLGDGWIALDSGLWTRANEHGEQEFAGIGEAGKLHALASLEEAEAALRDAVTSEASDELRAQLAQLGGIITDLRSSHEPATAGEVELRCSPTVQVTVDAHPIACGVGAKASASYAGCGYTATVETYAQTVCGYDHKIHKCGPKSGNPVSCSSTMTVTGPASCNSYAYAQIKAPSVNIYLWDQNYVRGACGPAPTTTVNPTEEVPYCPPPYTNCPLPY